MKVVTLFAIAVAALAAFVVFKSRDDNTSMDSVSTAKFGVQPGEIPVSTNSSRIASSTVPSKRQEIQAPDSSIKNTLSQSAQKSEALSTTPVPVQPFERYYQIDTGKDELTKAFESEAIDKNWAPTTTDTLSVLLASMPERAVMQDYGLKCKTTLCSIEVKGDASLLTAPTAVNNVQMALQREFAQPPMSREFDDQIMFVDFDPATGIATVKMIMHRRNSEKAES